ncbi:ABC transporter permease [Brevibacillus migulae]|uniref:ABC transporter permease n=1 Tax=Brevibacillus migulae TaxID=1644114 RepID=UPI00106E3B6F|nr:ABC transporter permease [Brevibacillus migulae]
MNKTAQLFGQEWRSIFQNRTLVSIMLLVPFLYFSLFGFLYEEKKITDVPTVVVDSDQTELSRELIRAFDIDQSFAVQTIVGSETEAMQLIDQGQAQVAVLVPDGLTKKVKAGQQAEVLTVIDGSNMMISNTVVRAASTIVKTVSAGVTLKKLEAKGAWGETGESMFTGIDYRYRVLYNPTFSYLSFMVFGLGGTVLQQTLFLGIALAITREKEQGTWKQTVSQHSFLQLLAGKAGPYLLISTFTLVGTYAILLKGFGVPYYGNLLHFLMIGTAFNIAVLAIGFAISCYAKSQLQATQTAMMIAVPSFMLSGFTWPLTAMPAGVAAIGKSLPLTYFLHGTREILSKGHGLSYLTHDFTVLLLMTLVGLFIAYVTYLRATAKNSIITAEQSGIV